MKYTQDQLEVILTNHAAWLQDNSKGERANLSGANLSNAELRFADLSGANLSNADLRFADLSGANLSFANLYGANLNYAKLSNANLSNANLNYANLSNASLVGASVVGIELLNTTLPAFSIVPEEGQFIGYKKLRNDIIATLLIPKSAQRVNSIGRKCRASKVKVLKLEKDGQLFTGTAFDKYTGAFEYKVGTWVRPDSFNGDFREECTHGIHFFITKKEAIDY